MQLDTIDMPRNEARQAFLDYRRAVRHRHDDEDIQIMRAYRALAQGRQVININDAIRQGGEDTRGLPRLTIARADARRVAVIRDSDGSLEFAPPEIIGWRGRSGARYEGERFRFSAGTLTTRPHWTEFSTWQAIVPNIPPALRPEHGLNNYHILFEARWEKIPRPPGDPALLKHLGGPLYAVLATWELTLIEQAILGVTRN